MKRLTLVCVGIAVIAIASVARAGYTWEYAEGKQCEFGADIRLRLTSVDRDAMGGQWDNGPNGAAVLPGGGVSAVAGSQGPKAQWMRVRERVWGCFDLTEDTQLMLRLGHRWHYNSSWPWDPNNVNSGITTRAGWNQDRNNWSFPDEVYVDQLYLDMKNVLDSDWSLRIGRQSLWLGNGMVLAFEGTPFDGGRSAYIDGVVATYQTECDTVTLFGTYLDYKDSWGVIANDQNRPLRQGDVAAGGIYWTHHYDQAFNTDLYYAYVDVNDDGHNGAGERNNAKLDIVGARVFGSPTEQMSYSLEYARQMGSADQDLTPGWFTSEVDAEMIDARLSLRAAEGTTFSPQLNLEYLYLSGDELGSNGATGEAVEGWNPVASQFPIWREELLSVYVMGGCYWTNLHQYRTEMVLQLRENVTLTTAWAYLQADAGEAADGAPVVGVGGTARNASDEIGHLFSAFLDIGVTENLKVALEASYFAPGSFFEYGQNSEWLRLETVYTF